MVVAAIVEHLMERERKVRAEEAIGDALPGGGSSGAVNGNDLLENLMEGGSILWCDSKRLKIEGSDTV